MLSFGLWPKFRFCPSRERFGHPWLVTHASLKGESYLWILGPWYVVCHVSLPSRKIFRLCGLLINTVKTKILYKPDIWIKKNWVHIKRLTFVCFADVWSVIRPFVCAPCAIWSANLSKVMLIRLTFTPVHVVHDCAVQPQPLLWRQINCCLFHLVFIFL